MPATSAETIKTVKLVTIVKRRSAADSQYRVMRDEVTAIERSFV